MDTVTKHLEGFCHLTKDLRYNSLRRMEDANNPGSCTSLISGSRSGSGCLCVCACVCVCVFVCVYVCVVTQKLLVQVSVGTQNFPNFTSKKLLRIQNRICMAKI